ncbi:hypothetical protein D3C76_1589990 [compost metagenome]
MSKVPTVETQYTVATPLNAIKIPPIAGEITVASRTDTMLIARACTIFSRPTITGIIAIIAVTPKAPKKPSHADKK